MISRTLIVLFFFFLTACASNKPLLESIENLPPTASGSSGINLEFWANISGKNVRTLTRNKNYPNNFSSTEIVNEIDFFDPKGDKYGQRIQGLLEVEESGAYEFWLSADDSAEIWISTDEYPINRRLIALVNSPSGYKVWDKYRSQKSRPMSLEVGKRYFVEILHKNNIESDYLNVSWKGPYFDLETLSSRNLKPYYQVSVEGNIYENGYHTGYQAGRHLAPYDSQFPIADTDGDGIPDFYESLSGLDMNNPDDAQTDQDNDLLSNLEEYLLLTNPLKSDTDGDGLPDGIEVSYGLSAINPQDALLDLDGDGISNLDEYLLGSGLDDANDAPLIVVNSSISFNWQIPTQREDGSELPIDEIQSYNIYAGTTEDNLSIHTTINDPNTVNLTIDNLEPDTYFFAISTVTKDGTESKKSPIISITL